MSAQKPSEYLISSGDEPRVYQAFTTDDLMGYHGGLMARQLKNADEPRFMLYAPIWDGDSAPFGFTGRPASHGLAVTADRFVITRNFHTEGVPHSAQIIPFGQVLCVHVGTVHLMGWFAVRHADGGRVVTTTIFHKATGTDLFIEAIRAYRTATRPAALRGLAAPASGLTWEHLWGKTPRWSLIRQFTPLLLDGEQPLGLIRSGQARASGRRGWRKSSHSLAGESVLVETTERLLQAVREPEVQPGVRSYGLNFTSICRQAVRSASLLDAAVKGVPLSLRLTLATGTGEMTLDVPFDESCRPQAQQIVGRLVGSDRHD